MYKFSGMLTIGLTLLTGLMLGAAFYAWWQKKTELAKRRIPRKWPLAVRPLVSQQEHLTWHWLVRSFFDHHVMLKMPVTRFTLPQDKEEGPHWFQLLNGVNCTFTVCTPEGHVVGCVDVPGPMGLSLSNQKLKHTLLSQCNIGYWVVDPEHLPSVSKIRIAFLGNQVAIKQDLERARRQGAFNESRANLHTALLRQRQQKNSDFVPLDATPGEASDSSGDSHLSSGWQENSFLTPLDSRSAGRR